MLEKIQNRRFLIVDDHVMIRTGLRIVIGDLFLDAVVTEAESVSKAYSRIREQDFDFIITDISFPQGDSLKFVTDVVTEFPWIRVLIFSAYDDNFHALSYLKVGAHGFISKQSDEDELRMCINQLVIKGRYIPDELKDIIVNGYLGAGPLSIDVLSPRELEVACLLVQGFGTGEISNALDIQQNTVSTIKRRIFDKLQIGNIPALIEIFNEQKKLNSSFR